MKHHKKQVNRDCKDEEGKRHEDKRIIEVEDKDINSEVISTSLVGEVKALCFLKKTSGVMRGTRSEQGTHNCRLEGNQNNITGRIHIHTINNGLIKEDVIVKVKGKSHKIFLIWKAFGRITRDLGSFEEETDKTTDLHQHFSRLCSQQLETASQFLRDAVTTASHFPRRRSCKTSCWSLTTTASVSVIEEVRDMTQLKFYEIDKSNKEKQSEKEVEKRNDENDMVILKEEDEGNDNYSSEDDDLSEEATSNQQQILTVRMVVKRRGRLENKLECEDEDEDEDEVEIMMIGTKIDKELLEHNLYEDDITLIICHNFSLTSNPPIKPKDSVNFRMNVVKPLTVHTPPSPHVIFDEKKFESSEEVSMDDTWRTI
nr:zinc finger, BED-type [Tanacetum cinerariifolium]